MRQHFVCIEKQNPPPPRVRGGRLQRQATHPSRQEQEQEQASCPFQQPPQSCSPPPTTGAGGTVDVARAFFSPNQRQEARGVCRRGWSRCCSSSSSSRCSPPTPHTHSDAAVPCGRVNFLYFQHTDTNTTLGATDQHVQAQAIHRPHLSQVRRHYPHRLSLPRSPACRRL